MVSMAPPFGVQVARTVPDSRRRARLSTAFYTRRLAIAVHAREIGMARARVLLLEDDPILLGVLREVLEDESLDVTVCGSLDEIKAALRQYPEAIVVRCCSRASLRIGGHIAAKVCVHIGAGARLRWTRRARLVPCVPGAQVRDPTPAGAPMLCGCSKCSTRSTLRARPGMRSRSSAPMPRVEGPQEHAVVGYRLGCQAPVSGTWWVDEKGWPVRRSVQAGSSSLRMTAVRTTSGRLPVARRRSAQARSAGLARMATIAGR